MKAVVDEVGTAAASCDNEPKPHSDGPSQMVGNAIFLLVLWGVSVFTANRFYVVIRYREINIKGAVYSKEHTPVMYWFEVVLIGSVMCFIGAMAIGMTLY
jgi:hypothetical protein